jgi:hypothetical protein
VKWLALIDTDEFVFPMKESSLPHFLSHYESHAGIGINWQVFGTSGVSRIPDDGLMIEHLTLKVPEKEEINRHIKSIVRPEYVAGCKLPHNLIYQPGYFQVDANQCVFEGPHSPTVEVDAIRIHHYTLRDEHFYRNHKLPRRKKALGSPPDFEEVAPTFNQVEDRSIFRFIPAVRQRCFASN